MTTAASQPSRPASRWFALPDGIGRILRNPALRALVGGQLIAALVILIRAYGGLQPLELLVYDTLRTAWAHPAPRDRIVLVGMTEADIKRWRYPLDDQLFADLLARL